MKNIEASEMNSSSGTSLTQGLAKLVNLGAIGKDDQLELHEGTFTTKAQLKQHHVKKPNGDIKQYLHDLESEIRSNGVKPAISLKDRKKITVTDVLSVLSQYEQVTCKSAPEPIYAKSTKIKRAESKDSGIVSDSSDVDSLDDENPPPLPPRYTLTADDVWNRFGDFFDKQGNPIDKEGWKDLINTLGIGELKKLAFNIISNTNGFKDTDPVRVMSVKAYAKKRMAELVDSKGVEGAVKYINKNMNYQPNKLLGVEARSAFSKIVEAKDVIHLTSSDNWLDIIKLMSSSEVKKLAFSELTKKNGFQNDDLSRIAVIKVYAEKRLAEIISSTGISGAEEFLHDPKNSKNYAQGTVLGDTYRELLGIKQDVYAEVTFDGSKLVNCLKVLGLNYKNKAYTRDQLNEAYVEKLRMLEEKNDVKSDHKRRSYSEAFEYLIENPPEWWGWDAGLEGEKVHSYDPDDLVVLGLDRESEPGSNELKKAYRRLALQHHPDKGGDVEKFQALDAAYNRLIKYFS
ncbi:J domain-containing protein [Endozoicomonas sp. SCSIO W0465]|uniref:J domain-containing protein n=1 Tax=Endozoicomonas sp. SCSIO W0465 TaxID=2918516 RepID=UPI0020751EB8|nr:J domain-containing protein [Endozoicomonas sp. SCSIO W0465]USE37174.1 J domain-containing protein [Endozoicomonas sp. SCSIO W0465]